MLTTKKPTNEALSNEDPVHLAAEEVPSFAFDPEDPWTKTLQSGLKRAALRGKKVYEVGLGTGINAAYLLSECGAAEVSGSDLDPRLADLAESVVNSMVPDLAHRFRPIKGSVSLVDTPEALAEVKTADAVIASLPQVGEPNDSRVAAFRESLSVPLAEGAQHEADDHIAHYYPWTSFDQYPYNAVGLGLNEALLQRIRNHAPQARVLMTFGARVGTNTIFECFNSNGYSPEKLSSQIVEQHAGTDISFFVALEKALQGTGLEQAFSCKFYADQQGKEQLSACEALGLVEEDPETSLFHEVCIIRGTPIDIKAA